MSLAQTILAPILNPRPNGSVDFLPDGALACDNNGIITFVGPRSALPLSDNSSFILRHSSFLLLPPFLDAHIHIPQHPIRGHFMDGIGKNPENGRLLAGLNKNVFPAEARCASNEFTERIVREFAAETLSQGVVGGAAYMTIHPDASEIALSKLGDFWSAGLVLMEMNCPEYLRVDPDKIVEQMRTLAERFGNRYIVTDRFAVAVNSRLRRQAVDLAREFDLRMQTHLNEQILEKELVEEQLYPDCENYTDVYRRDGLLDQRPILAHCVRMHDEEYWMIKGAGAAIAHCPTSNTLLGSGIMDLHEVSWRNIDWALCTDVGASPSTSLLAEMAQFLKVHSGRQQRATPEEALIRTTLAPARILGIDQKIGRFEVSKPLSFIEVACSATYSSAHDAILHGLLDLTEADLARYQRGPHSDALDRLRASGLQIGSDLQLLEDDILRTTARLEGKVMSVTLAGRKVFSRS